VSGLLNIRRAVSADAPTLSKLSADTFVETFGHLYSAKDLEDYLAHAYTESSYLDGLNELGFAAWLLENAEGTPLGFAYAGPADIPHDDVQPGDMQLVRLYLMKSAQSGGWGGRLMDAAMDWMSASAPRSMWIGVWSENLGAQRFYARYGFSQAGTYLYPVGETNDIEFIYRKVIS
jgi:ribosomal protein S18 acetylase RimI-like enzyme